MGKHYLVFLCLLGIFCFPLLHSYLALAAGTDDGSEQRGYVEVRPRRLWCCIWKFYRNRTAGLQSEPPQFDLAPESRSFICGVALGDSWISPEDFVFTWGPLLKDLSRMNSNGLNSSNSLAVKIQQQLAEGKYEDAASTWRELEDVVSSNSNNVDFYNFLLDYVNDPVIGSTTQESKGFVAADSYSRYMSTKMYPSPGSTGVRSTVNLYDLMNGPIRQKLKIIPDNVTWDGQGGLVFQAMVGDFMKPRIQEVDELLAKGINVTIYNGQVDLICSTKGAEAWVNKLKWDGLQNFLSLDRSPLYCKSDNTTTKGFTSSYKNLFFYWILGAGHFVPVEQPCVSLQMVGNVTKSPNNF